VKEREAIIIWFSQTYIDGFHHSKFGHWLYIEQTFAVVNM